MFVRENEGVYSFGTKKTNIKIESGNLKVRVGGGYLSIDEFVDQYLPIEFSKSGGAWRYTAGIETSIQEGPSSPTRYSPELKSQSPNTRKSNNIRQSVTIRDLKYNR